MRINCKRPEGNALYIIGAVVRHVREQGLTDSDALDKIRDQMYASASYWELLDAATTITQGEIEFINVPERN